MQRMQQAEPNYLRKLAVKGPFLVYHIPIFRLGKCFRIFTLFCRKYMSDLSCTTLYDECFYTQRSLRTIICISVFLLKNFLQIWKIEGTMTLHKTTTWLSNVFSCWKYPTYVRQKRPKRFWLLIPFFGVWNAISSPKTSNLQFGDM